MIIWFLHFLKYFQIETLLVLHNIKCLPFNYIIGLKKIQILKADLTRGRTRRSNREYCRREVKWLLTRRFLTGGYREQSDSHSEPPPPVNSSQSRLQHNTPPPQPPPPPPKDILEFRFYHSSLSSFNHREKSSCFRWIESKCFTQRLHLLQWMLVKKLKIKFC